MAHGGKFPQTNLTNESVDYLAKRDALRLAEIDLMRQCERFAELRRQLPEGALVQDYVFEEGPADLGTGDKPIRSVRPMCTLLIDDWNGVAYHLAQNVDVAILAAADPASMRAAWVGINSGF
jgi:predicted dithiol-disulfide oxidoreductase (DUF899 family)